MNQTVDRQLYEDVHATLLPVVIDPVLDSDAVDIIRAGARCLLVGETREEYVARRMSETRMASERPEQFQDLAATLANVAGERVVIALDQELGGIQRLHRMVPALPTAEAAVGMSEDELTEAVRKVGLEMHRLGVGLDLAPILDLTPGGNPWLAGRELGNDPAANARVGRAFIRGLAAAGVAATAKHFPGSGPATSDPHSTPTNVTYSAEELRAVHLVPFRAAVEVGVAAVMLGPVVVEALDRDLPASASPAVVRTLRKDLGFEGVIITDDLDSRSNARGRAVEETAILALRAGADLLLVGLVPVARAVAEAIVTAVADGRLPRARVAEAASRVRRLARG